MGSKRNGNTEDGQGMGTEQGRDCRPRPSEGPGDRVGGGFGGSEYPCEQPDTKDGGNARNGRVDDPGKSFEPSDFLSTLASAATGRGPDDPVSRDKYPRLFTLLEKRFDEEGRLLRSASITVRCDGEVYGVTLSVPWAKLSANITIERLTDLFPVLERLLAENRAKWRVQKGFRLKKGGAR